MTLCKVIDSKKTNASRNQQQRMFLYKKECNSGMTQSHVEPPPIPPIKGTYNGNSEKYLVKLIFD